MTNCGVVLRQDLDRHVENLAKNHKHEMGIERARYKESQAKLRKTEDDVQQLQEKLRVRSYLFISISDKFCTLFLLMSDDDVSVQIYMYMQCGATLNIHVSGRNLHCTHSRTCMCTYMYAVLCACAHLNMSLKQTRTLRVRVTLRRLSCRLFRWCDRSARRS